MYNKYNESLNIDCGCGPKPAPRRPAPVPASCGCPGEKLPSCDNQVDILIAQVKREIKELLKTTQARLLCQDKKIAETMVYVKNNLSNALRTLLSDMQFSGELDDIITETIASEISLLENAVWPIGNVKRYGAKGDGVTDDTNAIRQACAEAKSCGMALTAPQGQYVITGDIDAQTIKRIDFAGDIIAKNDAVVTAGNISSDGSGCVFNFATIPSLKIVGLKNSIVNFSFCNLLELYASSDDASIASIGYCQFYGSYCKKVKILNAGADTSTIAWINENVFRIKRIEEITIDGEYLNNNNRFEHCNLEHGKVNLLAARNNYISARCEGGLTVNTAGDDSTNLIEKEYYYTHYFGDEIEEYGSNAIGFYEINKLQAEQELLKIDQYNKSFPIGSLLFKTTGKFNGNNYNKIFRSNLIPIEHMFALKAFTSAKAIRVQVNFYNANKERILTEVNNFADGMLTYNNTGDWSYTVNANIASDTLVVWPGEAKYVEYNVIFGSNVTAVDLDYVKVKLLKLINTDVDVSNTIENNVYTSVPTSGYWERGQFLKAASPVAGAYAGIICVEAGSPGVWKNVAQIMS